MKKLFTLLLLGGLLLLGAENVWGEGHTLYGNWGGGDSWSDKWFDYGGSSSASVTISLNAKTTYRFLFLINSNGGTSSKFGDKFGAATFSVNSTSSALTSNGADCTIKTLAAGNYTFTISWGGANNSVPYLSVTYPGTYVRGNFSGSWGDYSFTWNNAGTEGTVDVYMGNNVTSNFGVQLGNEWYAMSSAISEELEFTDLTKNAANNSITSDVAGNYKYTIQWEDGSTPQLSVDYVTSGTTYTVSFTNPENWSNVYAYVWYWDGTADRKALGGFPGKQLSSNSISFEAAESAPSWIIWSDGTESHKTGDLIFDEDAIYDKSDVIKYSISNVTSDGGYATFYAPYNVLLPDGVDAYDASLGSSTISLSKNDSKVIPMNTAVVLKGSTTDNIKATTKSAGSFSTCLGGSASAIDTTTVLDATPGKTICVLGMNGGKAGFYHFTEKTLTANRAYLVVDAPWSSGVGAPSYRFVIENEENTTDIMNVEADEKAVKVIENGQLYILRNGVTYDATGRVVK